MFGPDLSCPFNGNELFVEYIRAVWDAKEIVIPLRVSVAFSRLLPRPPFRRDPSVLWGFHGTFWLSGSPHCFWMFRLVPFLPSLLLDRRVGLGADKVIGTRIASPSGVDARQCPREK